MKRTAPKPFIFVLMPFERSFDDVYQLGIKAACDAAGAYCERVDEQLYQGTILDRIYSQIARADFIIADMTGRNPNVYYEVGYAHALDKRVILLTQNSDDIPFDLKIYPHIVYGESIVSLKTELSKRVLWSLSNPTHLSQYFSSPIVCYINNCNLLSNYSILINSQGKEMRAVTLEIDFNCSTEKTIQKVEFQVGIIVPEMNEGIWISEEEHASLDSPRISFKAFKQSDSQQTLYLIDKQFKLLPGTWAKFFLTSWAKERANLYWEKGKEYEHSIRVFQDSGTLDFPFKIIVE